MRPAITHINKTILFRITVVVFVLALVLIAAAVRGNELGETYATFYYGKGFDLRIDSHAIYNGEEVPRSTWSLKNLHPYKDKFFKLRDVKPGDFGEATISFHVNKDAWVCLDFENLKERENGENEPESLEDTSGSPWEGELADGTEFFAWYDDGDDEFEEGEIPIFGTSTQAATEVLKNKTYALADSIAGDAFPANETSYIGIAWCAGDLEVDVENATVTCDGEALGNAAQTDSFSVDLSFRAVPKEHNDRFTCERKGFSCEWPKHGHKSGGGFVVIKNHNDASVYNNITVLSNSGGNSVSGGGTIVTGAAVSRTYVRNIINRIVNRISWL